MKITLAGYYGFDNVGDELLLKATIDGVRKRVPGVRLMVLSNRPKQTAAMHQIESVSRWNPFSIAHSLAGSDQLLFGGGGVFQDRTSRRSLLYYAGLIGMSRIMRTPVVLGAVGVDSLRHFVSRQALRLALGHGAVTIGVRDSASMAALEENGIHGGIGLFSDLVFSMELPPVQRSGHAVLVVRNGELENRNALFGWIFRLLKDRGLHVDAMSFQPGADARAAMVSGGPEAPFVDFREAPGRIAAGGIVVSARFHALVLAALAGRPFMGIGDPSSKVQAICQQLAMPFVPWDATREKRDRSAQHLFDSGPPDPTRVSALRRRAELAFDDAMGFRISNAPS